MTYGTIIKGIGGFYYVATQRGIAECRALGRLRKEKITPVTGDRVKIRITSEAPYEGAIEEVAERKSYLIRPPVANVDSMVIVISTASPCPDYLMIDKLIVTAERANIDIIIAVNKTDIAPPDEIVDIYEGAGFKTVKTCAQTGKGADELKAALTGGITAFAGNSGVGKSSLLNRFGFTLETGSVSKINRGRHTTRHTELLPLDKDRFIIDTPGFSLLEINDIKANELKNYFREFKGLDACRFSDCAHIGAAPGDCTVCAAVEKGGIAKTRYNSYVDIYNSLKNLNEWDK